MKSRTNITRFLYESTGFKGWRVSITQHGEVFTKYFSDKKCGGMKKSLAKAEECLKDLRKKLGKAKTVPIKRKNPKGRITGVSETTYSRSKTGEIRKVWVASWPEKGKRKVVKFPVAKHGARKARQLAIDARKEAEEKQNLGNARRIAKEDANAIHEWLRAL